MEIVIAAIVTSMPPMLAFVWRDIKKHTNGQGPIAKKLDCIEGRIVRLEDRTARIEERMVTRRGYKEDGLAT